MTSAPVLSAKLINIDCKPEVSFEILARVEADEHGKPRCKPFPVSRWYAHLGRLVGQTIRLTVTRQKGKRSDAQNRYLWSVIYEDYLNGLKELAANQGKPMTLTKDDLHFHFKTKFVGQPVKDFDGKEFLSDPTTTILTTEQFALYIEAIKADASTEYGIYIREANKDWTYEENAA